MYILASCSARVIGQSLIFFNPKRKRPKPSYFYGTREK